MDDINVVGHFFKAVQYDPDVSSPKDSSHFLQPFITISRQAGAGAQVLTQALITQMNNLAHLPLFQDWKIFDREINLMMTTAPDLKFSIDTLMQENILTEMEDILYQLITNTKPQSKTVQEMAKIVRGLAKLGKVIIVGRGGASLTRDLLGGVHVRLVASMSSRVNRISRQLNLNLGAAEKLVRQRDVTRARLIKMYFGRQIDDPLLYDMVWNTDNTPMDIIAQTTIRFLEYRARQLEAFKTKPRYQIAS